MRRINFLAAILVAGVAGAFMFASTAKADTIQHYTFGNTAQSVILTSDGSGGFTAQLGSGTSTYTLSPATPYNSVNTEIGETKNNELSDFTITSTSLISFAKNNGSGVFAATGSSTFEITDQNETETFSGTITWSYFKDGTNMPTLVGTATIGSVNYVIDLQLNSIGSQQLGTWAANATSGSTVSATVSSGELDMAPEPMSMLLMMFGFAMIGLVAIRRRPALANRLA